MTTEVVRLDSKLVKSARIYGQANSRNHSKQVEYWAKIGKAALDNPDLPVDFIVNSLKGKADIETGNYEQYKRSDYEK